MLSVAIDMSAEVKDKNSQPIKEGDDVWTPIRGGKREGEVEQVVKTEEKAREEGVKNPPKVSDSR